MLPPVEPSAPPDDDVLSGPEFESESESESDSDALLLSEADA